MIKSIILSTGMLAISQIATIGHAAKPIQHDAEYYVLLDQLKDQWASEDKKIVEITTLLSYFLRSLKK